MNAVIDHLQACPETCERVTDLMCDDRGKLTECHEMIPFIPFKPGLASSKKPEDATQVTLLNKGKPIGPLTKDAVVADTIVIDRGGFGVRIELEQPHPVQRGQKDTVLITLIQAPTPASKISLSYRLVPFAGP